jgi:hypothetical protein
MGKTWRQCILCVREKCDMDDQRIVTDYI